MRRFATAAILVLLPVFSFAQKGEIIDGKLGGILPLNEAGKVSYQYVKSMPDISRDELFKRARRWFVKTYNSAQSVLQTNDSQTGELAGKGIFNAVVPYLGGTHEYPVRHLISVEVKDGKYRTTLTDLVFDHPSMRSPIETVHFPMAGKKFHTRLYEGTNTASLSLIESLDKAMQVADDF